MSTESSARQRVAVPLSLALGIAVLMSGGLLLREYGPGTVPRARVWAVDVNPRARELTAGNAEALGLAGRVRVAAPDEVPDLEFAQIWSNPPVRVGKADLHALLDRWLPRLAPGGVAWLVIARHLGGDSLHQWLRDQGWRADRHASQKGYRVLRVTAGGEAT